MRVISQDDSSGNAEDYAAWLKSVCITQFDGNENTSLKGRLPPADFGFVNTIDMLPPFLTTRSFMMSIPTPRPEI